MAHNSYPLFTVELLIPASEEPHPTCLAYAYEHMTCVPESIVLQDFSLQGPLLAWGTGFHPVFQDDNFDMPDQTPFYRFSSRPLVSRPPAFPFSEVLAVSNS